MQHLITSWGYLAVFGLMLLESACIPVPSEVTMPLAGAISAGAVAGAHLNLALVIAVGTLGNLAGSYIAWGVGRAWGPIAVHRYGRYLWLRDADVARAQRWFERHGAASIFFARLLPVVRTFISLPAGVAAMPPLRFGLYTLAGCLPWTVGFAWAGHAIGANWKTVDSAFHGPTYIAAAIVIVAVLAGLVMLWRRNRHGAVSESADADG